MGKKKTSYKSIAKVHVRDAESNCCGSGKIGTNSRDNADNQLQTKQDLVTEWVGVMSEGEEEFEQESEVSGLSI